MLAACGIESAEQLFSQLPEAARLNRPLNLAPGISEYEIVDYFKALAAKTAVMEAGRVTRRQNPGGTTKPPYSRSISPAKAIVVWSSR